MNKAIIVGILAFCIHMFHTRTVLFHLEGMGDEKNGPLTHSECYHRCLLAFDDHFYAPLYCRIPLVADPTKEISADYGVLMPSLGIALRGLFIINPEGVLEQVCSVVGTYSVVKTCMLFAVFMVVFSVVPGVFGGLV